MGKYEFKFKENKGAFTHEMLDECPEEWEITVRQYLQFGMECEYIPGQDIDKMTDEQICEAVDWIDYLETK